ncbi:hypothetical protein LZL87_008067 [Fusarium oxysporum]|nr:hypothetical protein LZL87_008067 [Fusarium oxysporum]
MADAHTIDMENLAEQMEPSSLLNYKNKRAKEFLHDEEASALSERHFLRNIVTLIPDNLCLADIQELVKEGDEAGRKKLELLQERPNLEEARNILEI